VYKDHGVGNLARMLIERAVVTGACLSKVLFVNSGTEGVEAAVKFSRAYTRRDNILYMKTAFHGLTCGALSLSTSSYWYEDFGPLLKNVCPISLNDIEALEKELQTKTYAAFVMEPLLAEAGLLSPTLDFVMKAQRLCRKYGTLHVFDEVQTGMYRTGTFLHFQQFPGCAPDMVVMAKALSGGLVPVGCVLMTDAVYNTVIHSTKKSFVQFSTFGENKLSMRAAIATLEVIQSEGLEENTQVLGKYLKDELRRLLIGNYSIVKDVRGHGLLLGIEFQFPKDTLYFRAVGKIHPDILATSISVKLFREYHVLTQVCGNNLFVLKVSPPLSVTREQANEFLTAVVAVVHDFEHTHSFVSELSGIVSKALAK
jgi:ornithine--oxo-acid transaminase